jgi:D-alanine--poly(phosphoribitol) ligase subunit 2
MNIETVQAEIKEYVLETIVQGDSVVINNDTPLISSGIIDSISTLKMVEFLEGKYQIEFEPHEVDRENLDSVEMIAAFVLSKK